MIVTTIEVTEEVTTVTRMITRAIEVTIIIETSLEKGKGEPEKVPSSTWENEGSSINIWARMPSPAVWVIIYQKIQKARSFASMNLPMRNIFFQDVVAAIRSKKTSTKSTPG